MSEQHKRPDPLGAAIGFFPTTSWRLVLAAGDRAGPGQRDALAVLCQAYWYPIYVFIRRKGHDPVEAQDLTQSYFVRLLENGVIAAADPRRGRFRAFLRADCQHFLIDEHRRQVARWAIDQAFSIDGPEAESRYRFEPADNLTPDRLFDRAWARTLLDRVLQLLEHEYSQTGRRATFDVLKVVLTEGRGEVRTPTLATQLGITVVAVDVAIHRLRKRYRAILEKQIAATLDDPSEMDDEIRYLFGATRA
jgi:DNA-directed RNA polymerase specialized sigma24 family protein